MNSAAAEELPSYARVFQLAWPIILANAMLPLLGLIDTAVIGHTGTTADLGAIALGALIFNFVYWAFGCLRMGTTGFVARAVGAADEAEVRASLARALLMAVLFGTGLVVLQRPLITLALTILGASDGVESLARDYFLIRIWGAPASLATLGMLGTFIGLGMSRQLLLIQLFLNGLNIALDLLFAGGFGWGVKGIALGTALAEWSALGVSLVLVRNTLRHRHRDTSPFVPWQRLRDRAKFLRTLLSNADIMIRTLLLLFGFGWFTNQSAQFGDQVLAANHILLLFISFAAYFLDGYAHAAESLVGQACGAGRVGLFDRTVRRSTELAAVSAMLLAMLVVLGGGLLISGLTDIAEVASTARRYLPWAALYVLLSFAAFQLDGIFIGAVRTAAMRDASLLSLAVFLLLAWPLTERLGNDGLWLAFIAYVIARALALAMYYPALRRSVDVTA